MTNRLWRGAAIAAAVSVLAGISAGCGATTSGSTPRVPHGAFTETDSNVPNGLANNGYRSTITNSQVGKGTGVGQANVR